MPVEDAIVLVAHEAGVSPKDLKKSWDDQLRVSAGIKTRILNNVNTWVQLVIDCMESDPKMKIGEACIKVFETHPSVCLSAGMKSPRGMMRTFGMYVQMGYIKYNLNNRVSNRIGDKPPLDRVLYKDKSKMRQELKYLINTGVREKSVVVPKISRAFHHKYTRDIIETHLSTLPEWNKLRG